jgi:hypothetical protein
LLDAIAHAQPDLIAIAESITVAEPDAKSAARAGQ